MNTKLQKTLPVLFTLVAAAIGIEPFRECIKNDQGKIMSEYMGSYSPFYFCRPGQVLTNKTFRYPDETSKVKYCCDIQDPSAVQTASEPCLAFNCRASEGNIWRGDLLVHGPDLYCRSNFELQSFDINEGGVKVKASCCFPLPTTTTTTTTPETTTESTSKSLINWVLKYFVQYPKLPTLVRVRRQTKLPKAAAECIFADGSKTNPVPDYMSYADDGLTCRTGQIMLTSTRKDNEVYCCRYSSTSTIEVPQVIASRCVFENGGPLMWSMHTPGSDLVCKDPDIYEIVVLKTTHLITGKLLSMSCCKKIETTTTTTTTTPETTTKGTTPYTPLAPFPLEPGEVCLKAGNDCVYQNDGTLKINYMDFEAKGAYCRPNQVTRMEKDSKYRRRVCCEPSPGAKTIDLPPLCPTNCAFDDDGETPQKWSLMVYTNDLICKPGFEMKIVELSEGKKCCCMIERTTTTSTTSTTSTTTTSTTTTPTTTTTTTTPTTTTTTTTPTTSTLSTTTTTTPLTTTSTSSTSTKSTSTTTSTSPSMSTTTITTPTTTPEMSSSTASTPKPTGSTISKPTQSPADQPLSALTACYFTADRKVKTELMEICKPTKQCRANEVMLDETVNSKRYCCCDMRKELPPPTENDPKLVAPKCYYDAEGNVNPYSTLVAGLDLICPTTSQLMNYTDEKDPASCCILKTATTIPPKTVPPGTPPPTDAKFNYPDCTFKPDGRLDYKSMVFCSDTDKVCRPQYQRRALNFTTSKNQLAEKCCCELNTTLPSVPSPPPVYAPVCYVSPNSKTVKRWSMVKGGNDLVCKPGFKIYTADVLESGVNVPYSCCLEDTPTTPAPGLPDKSNYAGPQCTYKDNKVLQESFMEPCAPNMVCRNQEKVVNKTVKDPATNSNVLKCCCEFDPTLPPKDSKTPVRAHECYFDYFGYIVMNSLVLFGKDLECQKNFNLVNYTLDVEAKPTVFSCCLKAGATTMSTTPFAGPSIPTTLPMTTTRAPTSPGGKRTAAPKKMPDRVVKPGECPDCIMPPNAQSADAKWVCAHLARPGPPFGTCPSGYTMRRIYVSTECRQHTANKCCCEYDAFPLPVKLGA